ncbi:armadillo-type protein [Gongronella butleri]|nr:armadillo-type protein [Gongronella butleri]
MEEASEDFSKIPLQDRLQHKVWKARLSAYTELHDILRKTVEDSDFYKYEDALKGMVTDANAVAQEAGLNAVYEFVNNAPNATSTRDVIVPALVQKCLGAAKAGTKQKATDILLLYAEIDKPDPVVELTLVGLEAKQPKLVTQTVVVLKELVSQFGCKHVSPKPLIKVLPKMFSHSDKNVRAETFKLTTEIYRYVGAALKPSLSDLKPVQLKDLEAAFDQLPDERPVPPRKLRSEQVAQATRGAQDVTMADANDGQGDGGEPMDEEPVDPWDLADAVDINSKLPPNFYELIASKKWQERREALDALDSATKTPKIKDADYTPLVEALAKRVLDTNILLVGTAAACVGALATGLRTDFAKYKGIIAPPMVEKLKERKPAILEQLFNGLHAVFATVALADLEEDMTRATQHKNPQVRGQMMKLLAKQFAIVRVVPSKQETKTFATLLLKTLDDADAGAREHSAEGLGTLTKVVGEKMMLPYTNDLDDIKKAKIKEHFEKAEIKAKPARPAAAAAAAARPPPARKPAASVKKPTPKPTPMAVDDEAAGSSSMAPPKRKPVAKLSGGALTKKPTLSSGKKPATGAASGSAPARKAGGAAKLPPSGEPETISYKFSADDVESRATEVIPDQIWEDIGQSAWKVRLAAMEALHAHIEGDIASIAPELVIRCLAKKPGWKEMNFQVMTKMYGIMQLLATKSSAFTRASAAIGIPGLVEKLGDIKLKKPAGECLIEFAEKTSLQFVLSQAYPIWKKAKSPKVLADSLMWTHQAVKDFGIQGLEIRDLIDFIKLALGNTNASVRTSAVTVLGVLRQFIGTAILSFVQDVSPALMANIEAEFEKVSKEDPPQPTRGLAPATTSADAAPGSTASAPGGRAPSSGGAAAVDPLDALFPRVDIASQLAKVAAECNDANWKIRKEGLDKVLAIIEGANKRIKPNLGDFASDVLKNRLGDNNKLLQIQAVEITGLLAVAMGKPFDKYAKLLTGNVIGLLSDNKANVRNAGVATLEILRQNCGLDLMMPAIGTSLNAEAPMLRKDLLTWLATSLAEESAPVDASYVINPLFLALQDRNADVRKAAQAALPLVVAIAGYDQVMARTSELKGAQRQTVVPMIEAHAGAAPPAAAAAAPAAPAAPVPAKSAKPAMTKPKTAAATGNKLSLRKKLQTPRAHSSASNSVASSASASSASGPTSMNVDAPSSSPSASASATNGAPVLTGDPRAKQVRAKKEIRWQFDAPRSDIVDSLKHACDGNLSSEILALMFSTQQYAEKDRLQALQLLNDTIANAESTAHLYGLDPDQLKQRYICNADLILKYLTLRFFDTNTSMLIRCLDLTQHLIAVMDEQAYHLTEYEAISFLPFLINKVGDPKEVMRTRIRGILKSVCRIYPASKLFNYLLDAAANSKNAKTRAECLDEVGALIQRNGMSVMLPNKSLPLIATHIGDRDAGVRNAGLNAIAQAYILIGDAVFKSLTRLGEKEKSMIEERLKRTKPSASVLAERERAQQLEKQQQEEAEAMDVDDLPPISHLPQPPRTPKASRLGKMRSLPQPVGMQTQKRQPSSSRPNSLLMDQRQAASEAYPALTSPLYQPTAQPTTNTAAYHQQQHHQQQHTQPSEYIVDYLIAQITSGDPQPSIDALKQLDKYLNTQPDLILPDTDQLINAITLQVRLAYTSVDPASPVTTRLCKHLVNALVLFFSNNRLASSVPQTALQHLLQELAHRLLDQNMLALESGPQLSKALNVAMVKVLENSQKNATFSALLTILGTCSAGLRPGDSSASKETKYTELIMKCLWKLAKTIQENLRSGVLQPDQLLFEINQFFLVTPPSEWKRRTLENVPLGELPLRTVKTLLLELVNGLGDRVFDHLRLIDDPQRSSVYPYLHHMLEACRKREMQQQQQQPSHQHQHQHQHQQQPQRHMHDDGASAPSTVPLTSTMQSMSIDAHPQQQQQQQQYQQHGNLHRASYHEASAVNSAPPTNMHEYDDARLSMSSYSRPSSFSSMRSNQLMRSASIGSHPSSSDGGAPPTGHAIIPPTAHPMDQPVHHQGHVSPPPQPTHHLPPASGMATYQSNTDNGVQPMQIDDHAPNHAIPAHTDPTATPTKLPATMSDYEMNNHLKKIFDKIGTRDLTKQGIVELYEFQKQFPLAENKVNASLNQTGTYFQRYIRRGLSNLAADDHTL